MDLIKVSIQRPIAVISAVLMIVLFGLVALKTIPIQLAPDVNKPVITVTTQWPSAAPAEVEREITNRQEEVLKGINGLADITSRSEQGRARITLEFDVGTNMDRALLLVANRLDRVNGYPTEVDEPTLSTAGAEDRPIAWFILTRVKGNETPIHEFGDFMEDVVKDRIERVAGISRVNVYGGSEREIGVTVKPELLARFGLTVTQVVDALRRANASVSAGDVDEGKRRYVVRTEAELNTVEEIQGVVLRSQRDPATGRLARVTVGDIADVAFAYKDPGSNIRMLSRQAIAMNALRETGANVIETMAGIQTALDELEAGPISGAGLKIQQVYDETVYINSSIDLVTQNIWVGGVLAAIILLVFLRSWRATVVVSLAIPVSVIGSFVAMAALGRSLNVISLAGIAFAVGMVVDAAIVVLENIYRLREQGHPAHVAAYRGAKQVWGAVLVSALTTVMVFIPILIMELEVGQLFRDIAVAISVSVLLSLVVSITVLPALASYLLVDPVPDAQRNGLSRAILGLLGVVLMPLKFLVRIVLAVADLIGHGFVALVQGFVRLVTASRIAALGIVTVVSVVAAGGAYTFLPKLEYLPNGNRNLMFGIIIPPPGYNLKTMTEIAQGIEDATRHLWAEVSGPESEPGGPPKIDRFFFVAFRATTFIGAAAVEADRANELKDVLAAPVYKEPGTFALINQLSLFSRGIGGSKKVELDISGPDLETILTVAQQAIGRVAQALPLSQGNQFRPVPGLELGAPEIRVLPDRLRLADNGVSARELGQSIDAFNDGLRVAEVTVGGKRLDLMLKGPHNDIVETQGIGALPVVTGQGQILPASSLATIELTAGPTEIRHRERVRTVTIDIVPSDSIALEEAVEIIRAKVVDPLEAQGLPQGVKLKIAGTANKLDVTREAMQWDLLLAIIIVYLVMAVLFESFIYPMIILLSVPLAAAGGVAGLVILNIFKHQPLDMLTLLGFVILVGIVVNNAILLVHQALFHLREEGMDTAAAIAEATRNRIRPIFMSTLTSVVGMLPLVLFPGAGSELYQGLGSVVVGGLAFSAVLTLLIIPPMLSIVVGPLEMRARARKLQNPQTTEAF